jgi:serine protease Do
VNVSSSKGATPALEREPFLDDPVFRRFFGQGDREPRPTREGMGSGVVVSADGIVLTNNHVVDGADEIRVTLADKREFQAKVIGKDAKSDVAVLRLEGDVKGLVAIEFGDSSRLRLGDVVLAIGNPFGVGQTITMGIVSAKGRANVGIAAYEDFIQTDAAINPGNSGGALVDMEGRLVGINTAILSRSGGNMGIGFAIPSNMVQPIMKSLMDHGRVVRGWLGIGIQDVNQDLARALDLSSARGVLVADVKEGGPGDKAGLKSGDVILKINGILVNSTGELRNAVAATGAGSQARVELVRRGQTVTLSAVLGELPESGTSSGQPGKAGRGGALDGLTLEDLSDSLRQRLDLPRDHKKGAVVVAVEPGSAAATAGLRPGDVVLEVNRAQVTDVASFTKAYSASEGPGAAPRREG